MVACARVVVDQAVQGDGSAAAANNRQVVGNRYIAPCIAHAQAGKIIKGGRVGIPVAAIGVEFVVGIGEASAVRRKGGTHRQYLEDGVAQRKEGFKLFIALGRGVGHKLNTVSIVDKQIHRSARSHRCKGAASGRSSATVEHAVCAVAVLRDQVLDNKLASCWR